MSAFPKAAVQSVRIGVDLNVCLWPIADIQHAYFTYLELDSILT